MDSKAFGFVIIIVMFFLVAYFFSFYKPNTKKTYFIGGSLAYLLYLSMFAWMVSLGDYYDLFFYILPFLLSLWFLRVIDAHSDKYRSFLKGIIFFPLVTLATGVLIMMVSLVDSLFFGKGILFFIGF